MPGVPTFRGCDACHKQKKKCDQASPQCARCARLKIPCTGKGHLRYKFKEQTSTFAPVKTARSKSSSPKALTPPASPSNEIDRLASRFNLAMQVDDPKFDLKCFGDWFSQIGTRVGTNELLDNATATFLDAYDDLRSGRQSLSTLSKYGKSLTSLTGALQDPKQTKSPYTICAIFMIMIAQMWASKSAHGYISHMEGICHLLEATIDEPWTDPFALSLRYHLIIPAASCIEAMLNPNITINPRYLQVLKHSAGPYMPLDKERGQPIESLDLPCLIRFSQLIREAELNQHEMNGEYSRMQIECPFLRRRFMDLTNMVNATRITQPALVRAQIQIGVAYTVILSFTLILNAFLSAMDPTNIKLQEEALYYAQEAIWISRISGKQLPVGAGFMPAALFSAWVATDDSEVIFSIASTMKQCDGYWAEPHYVQQFKNIKERVREIRDRTLKQLRANGLHGMDVTDFTTSDGLEYGWGLDGVELAGFGAEHQAMPSAHHAVAAGVSSAPEQPPLQFYHWDSTMYS